MGPSCPCWIPLVLCLWMAGGARAEEDIVMIGKDKLWNAPRPDGPDLSVQYIWQKPRYPGLNPSYVKMDDTVHGQGETGPVTLKNAGERGRPKPGDEVIFGAVVRNVGTHTVSGFDVHWMFDGKDLESGWHAEALEPDQEVLFTIRRSWEDGRHFIALQVDRDLRIEETSEENNWVIDRTDALSFAFFVEESVREYFKTVRNGLGSYDWADWAQFQVRQMNKEFRDTIYPSCPGGIEERARLDSIWVIPDGWGHKGGMHTPGVKTPVNVNQPEFYNANAVSEDALDIFTNVIGGVDGVWGFSVDLVKPDPNKDGKNFYEFMPRWITGSEWPLHHELGHQLGRIDNYLIWGNNGVVMFRVTPAGKKSMAGFLDISHFNLAFWRGHEEHGRFTVKLEKIP